MTTRATHRHRVSRYEVKPWFGCVTPIECAANPHRQAAHGWEVTVAYCRCGAKRLTETNGRSGNRGTWQDA